MLHPPKSSEPIPGYVVEERIGVGGYGEVWSAQAPGGLIKAIKFVYGYFDDARASRELKALDRIKQVRHPFLLSLERFEVIDGQLVIVTELAEMSLKDRFEQAQESGVDGIPRDELLGYLRDAADALDYMSENYSLQHLDVKPENLLLVGGRVKVADFGLVKNLHEAAAASLMGGLTPIYAAPEVFDDRPSERSDQYSLAIVYQEMLCGSLPFPGRTPAQLATQHLHASPRLAALPAADQTVVAQALSKSPAERFASCRAMVDALSEADGSTRGTRATRTAAEPAVPSSDTTSVRSLAAKTDTDSPTERSETKKTHVLGNAAGTAPAAAAFALASFAPAVRPIADLPPIEVDASAGELRPTLFLGVGGTAGKALSQLRRRLADRFGPEPIPSIETLLIDTDARSLAEAASGDTATALGNCETMALPLRSAREYTSSSRNMMLWLSRRWLYNIPRSLRTEGRRPLGRLALVDHAAAWCERLRSVLARISSDAAVAASAERTGSRFGAGSPRVFVVASVSGGTGGGIVLDLTYAVRRILAELGCATDGVCQVLTHSTDRNPVTAELATANAYASLIELEHYARFGYASGEPACGLPPSAGDDREPAATYFVHLGDGLNDQEFTAATDAVASYLYLSSVAPAAATLEQSRRAAHSHERAVPLRSFALGTIGCSHSSLPPLAADLLCREIVDQWRGKKRPRRRPAGSLLDIASGQNNLAPRPAESTGLAQAAAEHAEELALAIDPLREQVGAIVARELDGGADAVFRRLSAVVETQRAGASRTRRLIDAITGLFEPPADAPPAAKNPAGQLRATVETGAKTLAQAKAEAIADWILHFVDDPAARLAGAVEAREWYAGRLRDLDAECTGLLEDTQHNLQALEQTLVESQRSAPSRGRLFGARRANKKHVDQIDGVLRLIVELRITECTLHGVGRLVRGLAGGVAAAGDRIKDLQHDLGQLTRHFDAPPPWDDDDAPGEQRAGEEFHVAAARELRGRLGDMVRAVDARFHAEFLLPGGGLRSVCEQGDALRDRAVDALRSMSRAEVLQALKQIAGDENTWAGGASAQDRSARLRACLDSARARFTDCGGAQRLLAILPTDCPALREPVSALGEPAPTIVAGDDGDLVLCYEQQDLSLAHVAARLIDGRNDIIQVAGRLHTRMDVPWFKLPQVSEQPAAECMAQP